MKTVHNLVKSAIRTRVLEGATQQETIDQRTFGPMSYTLELIFRPSECALFISELKTPGTSGGRQWMIPIPVHDPSHPAEVGNLANQILQAASASAPRVDDRTWAGRWFDKLTGVQLINVVQLYQDSTGQRKRQLSARITKEPAGLLVALVDEIDGYSPVFAYSPLASYEALHSWINRKQS